MVNMDLDKVVAIIVRERMFLVCIGLIQEYEKVKVGMLGWHSRQKYDQKSESTYSHKKTCVTVICDLCDFRRHTLVRSILGR